MRIDGRHGITKADDRGVSEVLAVALLIGIVTAGVFVVLLVGQPQLAGSTASVELGQTEHALVQFQSEAARVAVGGATAQHIDLGLRGNRGTLDVDDRSGHIVVEYVDFFENGTTTQVMNTSLGTVVYARDDTTIGYQGGGVWRGEPNGSVMVSPPEMTFLGRTFTMPVITTTSRGGVHSQVALTSAGATKRFPDPDAGLVNRVNGAKIKITIYSRYYRAWGRFFEDETGTIVQYNDAEERVSIIFLALPRDFAPDAGVIATSGPGEILLEGTGSYVDSYNSSQGPYSNGSSGGIVKAAGDIQLKGDSRIDGDSHAGKDVFVGSDGVIDGDVFANGSITVDGSGTITGNQTENADTVPEIPPINQLVTDRTNQLQTTKDNANTSVITDNELTISGDNATLPPGEYYLENLHLEGETLVLNVSGGNTTIAVRDWMNLEKVGGRNSHLKVEGSGTVRVYVASEAKTSVNIPGHGQASADLDEVHFFVERNGTIQVPGDQSYRFQLFATDNFLGAIGGSQSENPNVDATVIAPAGPEGSGQFYIKQGELFGAVVTGNLTLGQYGQVHFDRALQEIKIPLAPNVPRIEYFYLTEYRIDVESS